MTKKTIPQPWSEPPYTVADNAAIKALAAGVANEGQQKRALDWIIHIVCRTYDLSYRPGADGDRDTAFAEGKRYCGSQIIRQMKLVIPDKPTS